MSDELPHSDWRRLRVDGVLYDPVPVMDAKAPV